MLAKEFNSHADDSEEEGEEADVQSRGEAEGREEDEEEVALPIEASGEAAANRSQGPKAMRPTPTHRRGSAGLLNPPPPPISGEQSAGICLSTSIAPTGTLAPRGSACRIGTGNPRVRFDAYFSD
jgi:hypothetical protein